MRMACLEHGGTASMAGKVCVLSFSKVGRAAGLLEKDGFRVRFLFVLLFKCAKLPPQNFLLPLCIWLEVHLYKKSLHVLFKEILQ